MLQGSEYRLPEYFSWLRRTSNFQSVTKRRTLDYTKKATLLLIVAWILLLAIYAIVIFLAIMAVKFTSFIAIILAALLLAASPFIVAYGITVPLWLGRVFIQAPRERKMISEAREILKKHSGLKIAIAGSYGKTTAKEILQTVLNEGRRVAFTPGNMNTPIGISRFARTLDGDEEILIFELGEERPGDVKELCSLAQPDMGIITGINEAHLSSFGTLERTVATVFELHDYLGDKPLYKNRESPLVAAKISKDDKLAYSQKGVDGWVVSKSNIDIHGTSFAVKNGSKVLDIHSGLLGYHNIGIMGVAIAVADSVGLARAQITAGLEKTKPFEHRMQPRNIHGAWVIDDTYNGNSEGVQAGLLLLKELDAKRRVYVTPGLVEQGDKTQEVHEKIGEQIADVADMAVLMKNSVTGYIEAGLQRAGFKGELMIVDDPVEFYTNLELFVVGGDVVLMQNDWTDNYA